MHTPPGTATHRGPRAQISSACLVVGDEVIGTSFVENEEGGVFEGDLVLGKIDMEGKAIFNPANSEIVREVLRTQSSELMARVEAELVPEPNVGDQSGLFKNPAVNPTTPRNNAEEWTIDKFVINHEDLAESRLSLSGGALVKSKFDGLNSRKHRIS